MTFTRSVRKLILGILPLGLLGAAALVGCGGGGGGDNGNTGGSGNTGNNTGTNPTTSLSVTEPNGLTATLSENSATVAVNGSVTYTLTLTNNTAAAVSINYSAAAPTVPPAGLVVRDPSGAQLSGPAPNPPPFDTLLLGPGKSLTTTQTYTGYTVAGVYHATATFIDGSAPATVGPLAVTAPLTLLGCRSLRALPDRLGSARALIDHPRQHE